MGALAGNTVTGRNGCRTRSGARTLDLLAAPLNCQILRELHAGPKRQADLQTAIGHPAQSTLRAQLKRLWQAQAIEKRRRNRFPGVLEYALSEAGIALLPVVSALERWLGNSSGGSLGLDSLAAKAAVRALIEGWTTTMLRALAAAPLTLTELDRAISTLNYPSVERRLAAMRLAGLIEELDEGGLGKPYAVTEWTRHAAAPLVAAAHWERLHAPQWSPPFGRVEFETTVLLVAPLMTIHADAVGTCRLALELPPAADRRAPGDRRLAGVVAEVADGRVSRYALRTDDDVDAWALGSANDWIEALARADSDGIEIGGDGPFARSMVNSLHSALFENTDDSIPN